MAVHTRDWRDRWLKERNRTRTWFQVSPRRWVIRAMIFSASIGLLLVLVNITGLYRPGRRKRVVSKNERKMSSSDMANGFPDARARSQMRIVGEMRNHSQSTPNALTLASSSALRSSLLSHDRAGMTTLLFSPVPADERMKTMQVSTAEIRIEPKMDLNPTASLPVKLPLTARTLVPLSILPLPPPPLPTPKPAVAAMTPPQKPPSPPTTRPAAVSATPPPPQPIPSPLPLPSNLVSSLKPAAPKLGNSGPSHVARQSAPAAPKIELGAGAQFYTVQTGDTMTAIAARHHVPLLGLLAVNADVVTNPDQITVGQQLRVPTADDALVLAGAAGQGGGGGAGWCNHVRNPSFEEAVDEFGLAVATEDAGRGRYAAEWRGLQAVVAGQHYEVDRSKARSGTASLRMQGGAVGAEAWKGFYQHTVIKQNRPGPLGFSLWVAAEALTEGAGVYVDVEMAGCRAGAEEGAGWRQLVATAGGEKSGGCHDAEGGGGGGGGGGGRGGGGGWGKGARTGAELFVKDVTAVIPAGSYGWWPVGVKLEGVGGLRVRSVTIFVLLRGAFGTLWLDDVGVWGVDPTWDAASAAAMGFSSVASSVIPLWWTEWPGRAANLGLISVTPFHRQASRRVFASDVTAVTQLSVDRLPALERLARQWGGGVSAAVLVTREEQRRRLEQWWVQAPGAADTVDLHVVEWDERALNMGQLYPVNFLRNVAIKRSRSEVVLILDVDFVPFTDGAYALSHAARKLSDRKADGAARRVYVVPAFEQLRGGTEAVSVLYSATSTRADSEQGGGTRAVRPAGALADMMRGRDGEGAAAAVGEGEGAWMAKSELLTLFERGVVGQVHGSKFAKAHGPTDYLRWFKSGTEYAVAYESEYEPYILCRRDIPPFDVRFSGYGADKSSHIYELSRSGHVLVVLPGAFILHEAHAPATWSSGQNWTRAWMDWTSFVADTNVNYSPNLEQHEPRCTSLPEQTQ